jgi:hypothetical protein
MKCCIDVGIEYRDGMRRSSSLNVSWKRERERGGDKNQLKMNIYNAIEGMILREECCNNRQP